MAGRLLVVQNDPDKPLGRIGDAMVGAGLRLEVHSSAAELPAAGDYDGLVVLPGLADPVDDLPAVHRGREAIAEALEQGLPVLGLCLGGQLLVHALGGQLRPSRPELGFAPVRRTDAATADPLLARTPDRFTIFHAHAFAFEPPANAEVLLVNDVCTQACRLGDNWAFQCHPEVSAAWVGQLASGLRGQPSPLLAGTVAFFARHGVSPEALEAESQRSEAVLARLAEDIGRGFAARVVERAAAAHP